MDTLNDCPDCDNLRSELSESERNVAYLMKLVKDKDAEIENLKNIVNNCLSRLV
jgi:hypothetical protein